MKRMIALYNLKTGALKNAKVVEGFSEQALEAAKRILIQSAGPDWVVVDSDVPLNPDNAANEEYSIACQPQSEDWKQFRKYGLYG